MRKLLFVAPLLLALGACAASPSGTTPLPNPLPVNPVQALANLQKNLGAFTVKDLQNAESIAKANNDTIAEPCYPALITFVQSLPNANGTTTVSGAISAFEQARVLRLGLTGMVTGNTNSNLTALRLACSPLLLSEQQFLINLGLLSAGGAIAAPAAAAGATTIGGVLAAPFAAPIP